MIDFDNAMDTAAGVVIGGVALGLLFFFASKVPGVSQAKQGLS